ncbi:cytochrome P450 2B19-like [Amphiura filiformis]|uniref:cytochrome P450 2B19-like n=1 Tax=Amphiura filiformis TaxID=82378 RepID=UPI003B2189F1
MAEFRKFDRNCFRGFGIGERSFEDNIVAECKAIAQELDGYKGIPCNPHHFFVNGSCNVLFSIVFGERRGYDDEQFRHLTDLNSRIVYLIGAGFWHMIRPKYCDYLNRESGEILEIIQDIYEFIDTHIEKHRQDLDAENPKDLIDLYLKAMEDAPKPDDPFSYLQEDNMRGALYMMFFAGADTVSTTLDWCCLYMMAYSDVQKKIQKEIDSVVGRNRLPQLSDQTQMPFTRAALLEVQRHVTLLPLSVFHTASADTTFRGYRIPKGATIVSNLYAVMKDPIAFLEPDRFNPERFINEAGEYFAREEVCPFGVGRRICTGKQLANMELFIFFTHLLHRYSLVKPNDAPPFEGTHGAKLGATFTPEPFTVKFVVRE